MRPWLRLAYGAIAILVIAGGAVAAAHRNWSDVALTGVVLLVVVLNAAYGERGARRQRAGR